MKCEIVVGPWGPGRIKRGGGILEKRRHLNGGGQRVV